MVIISSKQDKYWFNTDVSDCYEFDELEMNRIIACAFQTRDVKNIIELVKKERPAQEQEIEESEGAGYEEVEDALMCEYGLEMDLLI